MFFMGATPLGRSPIGNPNVEKEFSSFTSLQDLPVLRDAILHCTHPCFLLTAPLLRLLCPQCFLLVSGLSQDSKLLSLFQSLLEMKVGTFVSEGLVIEQQIQTLI
jgi:hypothetical protein